MIRPRMVPMPADDDAESSRRHTGSVRASIFDSFYQLGGMDQDSQLADWMFNDSANYEANSLSTPPASPPHHTLNGGSKFTERFDAESIYHFAPAPRAPPVSFRIDPQPEEDRSHRPSRAGKLLQRMRSKSRTRTTNKRSESRNSDLPTPPPESPPSHSSNGIKSFFRRPASRPSTPPGRAWSMFRKSSNEQPVRPESARSSQDTLNRSRSPLTTTTPTGNPPNTVPFPSANAVEPFIHRRGRAPSKGSVNLLDNEAWEHMSALTLPSGTPNPYLQGELFIPNSSNVEVHQQRWDMRRAPTPSMASTASSDLTAASGNGRRKLRRTRSRPDSGLQSRAHGPSASNAASARSRELSLQRSTSHL